MILFLEFKQYSWFWLLLKGVLFPQQTMDSQNQPDGMSDIYPYFILLYYEWYFLNVILYVVSVQLLFNQTKRICVLTAFALRLILPKVSRDRLFSSSVEDVKGELFLCMHYV